MRHMCSGEDVCGMVKKNDQGYVVAVSDHMNVCAERIGTASIHCGLIRSKIYFERGQAHKKREVREESLYQLRMVPMFKDETKGDFISRMRRATKGAYEKKPGMRVL